MHELPEGWEWKKLGEVGKIVSGGTPSTSNPEYWDGNISWITPADLSGYNSIHINKGRKSITNLGLQNSSARLIPKDSVLFSSRAPIGYVAIAAEVVCTNQGFKSVVPNKSISSVYLYHFLKASKHKAEKVASGTTFKEISLKSFSELDIPLPPLPIQQAIVTKIEEIFSELDHGVAQLKLAQQQLKVYRQSVLNSAIVGKAEHTIESVIESLDQGWSPKCYNEPSRSRDEWAVIKTTAVQAGYFQEEENKKLPEDLEPRKQHELKKGDLLITRAGPRVRVGICCLVKKTRPKLINCDKVYRMRINSELAIPEYVEILLNAPKYSKEIEKMKTGISDSGVNLTQKGFLKILIPLPPLSEQHQIVAETERRLSVCDKLEETIVGSLKAAEVLRAGVLKRAFEGKLV